MWGDNSGGQGGPSAASTTTATTTTTTNTTSSNAPSPSKSPSKSPNKLTISGSSITSPRRLEVPEEQCGGLMRDLASGDNYLIVITVDGLTYYVGKLRYRLKYYVIGEVKLIYHIIFSGSSYFPQNFVLKNLESIAWESHQLERYITFFRFGHSFLF